MERPDSRLMQQLEAPCPSEPPQHSLHLLEHYFASATWKNLRHKPHQKERCSRHSSFRKNKTASLQPQNFRTLGAGSKLVGLLSPRKNRLGPWRLQHLRSNPNLLEVSILCEGILTRCNNLKANNQQECINPWPYPIKRRRNV